MSDFVKDFRPAEPRPRYDAAVAKLQAADSDVLIAHIDSGLAPHSVFGGGFPAHILIDQGRNFYDPGGANGHKPITDLSRGDDIAADLIEYPDHGVKTLSVILGEDDTKIHGVAPRTKIVPYRVSNGPLFRGSAGPRMDKPATARIGQAIDHALDLPTPPSVISISMGNPGHAGLFEFFRTLLGGSAGMAKETKQAINKAYERGVIIVCAAGQIIEAIVEPALFPRTIAVGGFDKRGGDIAHYPTEGYNLPQRIDIWAQAQRVNRAAYNLNASPPQEIYADEMDTGDPSGTSYACPQVAASAALWVATHQATLETSTFADTPWRKVEAFRNALKRTATHMPARLPFNKTTPIRMLEIERLLGFAPEVPADSDKKPAS